MQRRLEAFLTTKTNKRVVSTCVRGPGSKSINSTTLPPVTASWYRVPHTGFTPLVQVPQGVQVRQRGLDQRLFAHVLLSLCLNGPWLQGPDGHSHGLR